MPIDKDPMSQILEGDLDYDGMATMSDALVKCIEGCIQFNDLDEKEVALVTGALFAASCPSFDMAHSLLKLIEVMHDKLPGSEEALH